MSDDLVVITLEELKYEIILVREAFEKIREILEINLELFSAKKNVHNAALIAKLMAAKLFPSFSLNPGFIEMYNKKEIEFRDDDNFGKRITKSGEYINCTVNDKFPSSITIACSILISEIRYATSDRELKIVIDKLDEYIDSTGDILKPEDIWE